MKGKLLLLTFIVGIFFILATNHAQAQGVVISNDTNDEPNASAMLEVKSTDKGLLIPRMTTAQRTSISSPADGLLVYDTDAKSFYIFGNTKWTDLSVSAETWTNASPNVFLTNSANNVGIGTATPGSKLVIQANDGASEDEVLFEVNDNTGTPILRVTSAGVRIYVKDKTKDKAVSGGFAVGQYGSLKAEDNFLMVTPYLTRVNTLPAKGISGGFAVGQYGTLKSDGDEFFTVTPYQTRVNTLPSAKANAGGFAVGQYGTLKGGEVTSNFYTNPIETRVFTDDPAKDKAISGGFAVGQYGSLKANENYMFMVPDNYFVGHQAGYALQTNTYPGLYNTFFGYQSGYTNEAGSNNVFVGYQSGFTNLGGNYNVLLGNESGYNLTTGSDNVLLGYKAGYNVTTAGNNISIGSEAGFHNTNNSDNIFLGRQAGYYQTNDDLHTPGDYNNNIYLGFQAGYGHTVDGNKGSNNIFMGTKSGYGNRGGTANVFIGEETGYSNISGNSNVFIGYYAGHSNDGTMGLQYGNNNVFLGNGAGFSNTQGYENVFLGYAAGYGNTDGINNVFLGFNTGDANTSGYDNTFIGTNSGGEITIGIENTFLGCYAGQNATGGNQNIFIGVESGQYQASGNNNVYLGNSAGSGQSTTITNTGYDNVYIGSTSGQQNTTGMRNVFLGFESGQQNTTGHNNVFLGEVSGKYNTTGYDNIFIGRAAGAGNSSNNITGSTNTCIGYYSGNVLGTGQSNALYGSNSGAESTGSSNTFIGADAGFSSGSGSENIYIGRYAGMVGKGSNTHFIGKGTGGVVNKISGNINIFIGGDVGTDETGSNLLMIDITSTTTPLIWGNFANGSEELHINGDLTFNAGTNSITLPTTRGTTTQVLATNASTGQAYWRTVTSESTSASNGLYESGNNVRLGGSLIQNTTVTQSAYDMIFNLTSTGDFYIRDNGTTKFTMQDNGNVGIGTASPGSHQLSVISAGTSTGGSTGFFENTDASGIAMNIINSNSSSSDCAALITNQGTGNILNLDGYPSGSWTRQFVFTNNGRLGIRTDSPGTEIDVDGTIRAVNSTWPTSGYGIEIAYASSIGYVQAYNRTLNSWRDLRLGGDVGPVNDNQFSLGSSSNRWTAVWAVNGTIQTSDKRLKENISDIAYGLSVIQNLKPVSYNWIDDKNKTKELGFIAQDIQNIIPEAVKTDEHSDLLGLSYASFTPIIVKAIQEQQSQIKSQQQEINELKKRLEKLERMIENPKN